MSIPAAHWLLCPSQQNTGYYVYPQPANQSLTINYSEFKEEKQKLSLPPPTAGLKCLQILEEQSAV